MQLDVVWAVVKLTVVPILCGVTQCVLQYEMDAAVSSQQVTVRFCLCPPSERLICLFYSSWTLSTSMGCVCWIKKNSVWPANIVTCSNQIVWFVQTWTNCNSLWSLVYVKILWTVLVLSKIMLYLWPHPPSLSWITIPEIPSSHRACSLGATIWAVQWLSRLSPWPSPDQGTAANHNVLSSFIASNNYFKPKYASTTTI